MTKVPQGFDFSFLNEEEARKILQVLERNEELRRAEKDRIRYEANSSSWAGPASCWLLREPRTPAGTLCRCCFGVGKGNRQSFCGSPDASPVLSPGSPSPQRLCREEGESSSFFAFLCAWVPACSGHLG